MYDVICVGGATQDIFFIDPNFPVKENHLALDWGEKFLARDSLITYGGGAANTAVGLSRLGFKTAFWGQVGEDLPGAEIAKNFKAENVSLEFLKSTKEIKTSISAVMVGAGGEHAIVMYRGKNDDLEQEIGTLGNDLSQTRYFYLSDVGSTSEALTDQIIKLVKRYNLKLAFVPGQNQLKLGLSKLAAVLQVTEVFILNVYEAYELLNWPFEAGSLNSCGLINKKVEEALSHFHKLGAKNVVITRDVCGSQAYDGQQFYLTTAPVLRERVDTTGAGDSFAVGVLAALLQGEALPKGLEYGNAESAAVIGVYGAQPGLIFNLPNKTS